METSDLVRAAREGDVDEVRRLVGSEGADPGTAIMSHAFSHELQEALRYASGRGYLPVACYFVEEVGVEVDQANEYGWTALHCAACGGRLPVVQYLVETGGANVEARNIMGATPLHLATTHDVAKYLVEEQQANVNAKDENGSTPLDGALLKSEVVFRYLLTRSSCIAKTTLRQIWDSAVDIRGILLEKYALGRGLANAYRSLPIHTLFAHFPLPSDEAFQDAIKLFPSSALSLVDTEGRLSMHVALTSQDTGVKSPLVISTLFEREQRSALARDPTTGLYPHETAAILLSKDDDVDENGRLDLIYKMFCSNPQQVIQCRLGIGRHASLPDTEDLRLNKAKRPRLEQRY